MTLLDLVLLPFYIGILYLIFRRWRKKLPNETLKKYHRQAFWVKIIASILFVIYYTYLTGGDTRSLYYNEGYSLYHHILQNGDNLKYLFGKGADVDPNLLSNPGNIGYLQSEANFMVVRLAAILCFFTFGSFVIINLIFGSFALSGLWKLFQFFYEQRPGMHKAFAISVLFFPSVVFWSAGLLKDSLCIGSLGWLTYSLYQISKGKRIIKNALLLIMAVYMIVIVKVYILLAYAPILLLYLFLIKLRNIRIVLFKYLITIAIIFSTIFIFSQTYDSYQDELDEYAIENLTATMTNYTEIYENMEGRRGTESNFNLGAQFDGTFTGLIKISPYALTATFYRPFIWETNKISQIMAAIESIILLIFSLSIFFRAGPFKVVRYILSDPMTIFCLLFALVFGIFVGTSTLNFGTLVRYKIPCMPFYTIALYTINEKLKLSRELKKARAIKNIQIEPQMVIPA